MFRVRSMSIVGSVLAVAAVTLAQLNLPSAIFWSSQRSWLIELHSKSHVTEKKNNARAASNESR
jgi:hypothetical protein